MFFIFDLVCDNYNWLSFFVKIDVVGVLEFERINWMKIRVKQKNCYRIFLNIQIEN